MLRIGEPERGAPEEAAEYCIRQLEFALEPALAAATGGRLLVAHEPIWAIGAAEPAAPEYVTTVCRALRAHVRDDALFPGAQVIYGRQRRPGLLPRIAADADGMFWVDSRMTRAPCGGSSTRSAGTSNRSRESYDDRH